MLMLLLKKTKDIGTERAKMDQKSFLSSPPNYTPKENKSKCMTSLLGPWPVQSGRDRSNIL